VATTLKSPGSGYRALQLSDGSTIWMQPGATTADYQAASEHGEAALNQKYMAQAQAENRPITTNGKVYSATAARPNGPYGQLMGWLDHNLGGNALNRSSAAPVINAARPALSSGERIATGAVDAIPIVGAADLASTGLNVGKHLLARAAPAVDSVPDLPTASGWLRNVTGTPPLPADASPLQRITENTLATMANPSSVLGPTIARTTGAEVGSDVGGAVAGEPGQFIGSFAGASPDSGGNVGLRVAKWGLGGEQAPEVAAAGQRIGVQPTFGMVANPTGRRVEKSLASFPFLGGPIQAAQIRAATGLDTVQQGLAEKLYGGNLPLVSPATIGEDLVTGARQGAANITQRAQDEQGRLASQIGQNQPVNLRPVYQGGAAQKYTTSPTTFSALAARLDALRQMAIEAQTPRFQAVSGQMPAGSAPYSRVMNTRSDLGADIPGVSGMSGGVQKNLYASLTDAMRAAAVAKDPALGPAFDFANENYQRIMGQGGQRDQLENVGGQPVKGYNGLSTQSGGTVMGAPFQGGKDEGQAFNYLTSKLNSPSSLDVFSNPTIVPNDFWRRVSGGYLSTLGQTKEGTYRPDIMAQQWGKVDPQVADQLFTGPSGQPLADVTSMNDAATLGRNAVVPVERAGLTNTAGAMLGVKTILDALKAAGGFIGTLGGGRLAASGIESPTFVNAMSGNITPLTDTLYNGLPAATQTILQAQNNQQ
jgi:hypothetical protein